jgi:hypothetical protein
MAKGGNVAQRRASAVAALLFLSPVAALCQEQELKRALAECAAIEEHLERLACFDSLAQGLAPRPAPPTPALGPESVQPQASDEWRLEVVRNPIDDSTTIGLSLIGTQKEAELMLRCRQRKAAVLLSWHGRFIGASEPLVSARFGSAKAEKKRWSLSGDHKAAFAPGDPKLFIRQLISVDRLVIQTDHFSRGTTTDVFDVHRLHEFIAPLTDGCPLE